MHGYDGHLSAWYLERGHSIVEHIDTKLKDIGLLKELYGFGMDIDDFVSCSEGQLLDYAVWPSDIHTTLHYLMIFIQLSSYRYELIIVSNEDCTDKSDNKCFCGHLLYGKLLFKRTTAFKPTAGVRSVYVQYTLEEIYGIRHPKIKNGTGQLRYEVAIDPGEFFDYYGSDITTYYDGIAISEGFSYSGAPMGTNYRQVTLLTEEWNCSSLAKEFGRVSGGLFGTFAGAFPSLPSTDKRDPGYWMLNTLSLHFEETDVLWFKEKCLRFQATGGVIDIPTDTGGPGSSGSP